MKKLLAIMMALVMCCSLVVSASAEEYDGDLFWMDIDLDGEWTENYVWDVSFETEYSGLQVYVYYPEDVDGTLEELFYEEMEVAYDEWYNDEEGLYGYDEGEIDDCPAFCLDYFGDEGYTSSIVLILTDNYIYEISIYADDMEYDYIWEAVMNITVWDVYSGEDYVEEDDYYEDDYYEDEEIVEEEEEEIVEEEEEEDDDKKPSKNDKDDKDDEDDEDDEDDDKKKDKKDKDDDEDEDEKDNTTLIIIIVAGVAVVAIAAVVIVLVTKKKK